MKINEIYFNIPIKKYVKIIKLDQPYLDCKILPTLDEGIAATEQFKKCSLKAPKFIQYIYEK